MGFVQDPNSNICVWEEGREGRWRRKLIKMSVVVGVRERDGVCNNPEKKIYIYIYI